MADKKMKHNLEKTKNINYSIEERLRIVQGRIQKLNIKIIIRR